MNILESIHGHDDLIALTQSQREQLCGEIREFLVNNIAKTGGHLASNLGVVELSLALETVFDTQYDRLVFDVGHQSYVHKLLTGRQADFGRLRQFGGMAGFPKPGESDADAFVAGHASSAVSIALGMARARSLQQQNYNVIALLGDGAATGGMVYEGLNDTAESGEPMIVILNDNAMSIDRNVGGMANHLSRIRSSQGYQGMKSWYRDAVRKIPGGETIYNVTRYLKNGVKRTLLATTIFENMGLEYLGPVDGHDLSELMTVLRTARDMKCPVLVHVITRKGLGYIHAEKNPARFHGIGKFDPKTGESVSSDSKSFSQAFGEKLRELAGQNDKVCAITAAMPGGTGLLGFKEEFPKRLFDVGIAEEHAVSMAGGLAKQGMIPAVAIYSTFLQRSFDQIMQDVGMLGLHCVFAIDRAGLVGEDGETHHGIYDIGFLRQVPGMEILCPASTRELEDMLEYAVLHHSGPIAVRYPRGGNRKYDETAWNSSRVCCHRTGKQVTLVTYGTLVDNAMEAAEILAEQGIEASVLRLLTVGSLPVEELKKQLPEAPVVVLEETGTGSGIRESLAWEMKQAGMHQLVYGIDLGSAYVTHGSMKDLYMHYGLDGQSAAKYIREVLSDEN